MFKGETSDGVFFRHWNSTSKTVFFFVCLFVSFHLVTFFLFLLFASPKDALPPTTPSIIIIIIVVLFLYLVLFPLPFSFLLPLFFSNINPFACSLQVACVFHLRLHEIYKSLHHGRLPTPAPLWSGVCLISSLNDQLIPS